MALSCDRLNLNKEHCSANFSPSRQSCQPIAFVLHNIPIFTTESYLSFTKERYIRGKGYDTDFPKSVHYLIGENGDSYQLVELHDRAWGVSSLKDPSWSALNECNWSDHEDLLIHIGFIGNGPTIQQINIAAEIMCCVVVSEPSISIKINEVGVIVARDLNINLNSLDCVPDSIIPKTQVCVQQGGKDPFFTDDIGTYGNRISELEVWRLTVENQLIDLNICCCENRDAIAQLQDDVAQLQADVADINVESLEQRIDALEDGNLAAQKRLVIVENCLECAGLCTSTTLVSIHYRLDNASAAKLVPGAIQIINFPIKVNDTTPPIVSTGPLWFAELLTEAQTSCTTFKISASARLSSASWCLGRVLELYAIVNSENILLDQYEAEAGFQSASVFGETTITIPPDTTISIGLKTDEDLEPLEVVQASVIIECLDGLLSPNCVECDTV